MQLPKDNTQKVGGQIQNYADGTINTSVFSHEMGHCFFMMIYTIQESIQIIKI